MSKSSTVLSSIAVPGNTIIKRRGLSWQARSTETAVVFQLQRSSYSDLYFPNFGVWLQTLDSEGFPRPERAHFNGRLGSELLRAALDFEEDYLNRLDFLNTHFSTVIYPLMQRCLTLAGATSFFQERELEILAVQPRARASLGL